MMPNPSVGLARMVTIDFAGTKLKLQLGKKKFKGLGSFFIADGDQIPSPIDSPSLSRLTILNLLSRFFTPLNPLPPSCQNKTIDM